MMGKAEDKRHDKPSVSRSSQGKSKEKRDILAAAKDSSPGLLRDDSDSSPLVSVSASRVCTPDADAGMDVLPALSVQDECTGANSWVDGCNGRTAEKRLDKVDDPLTTAEHPRCVQPWMKKGL